MRDERRERLRANARPDLNRDAGYRDGRGGDADHDRLSERLSAGSLEVTSDP